MEDDLPKQDFLIKKINNLALCHKLFIGREVKADEIEINGTTSDGLYYTLASFNYDKDNHCYVLKSCGARLDNNNICWEDFGILVLYGYNYLRKVNYHE